MSDGKIPFQDLTCAKLIAGPVGSGKTFFSLHHPLREQAVYLDVEGRYKITFRAFPELKETLPIVAIPAQIAVPCVLDCKTYEDDMTDPIATLRKIDRAITKIRKLPKPPKLVVVDSIGDIRRYAIDEWEHVNKKRAFKIDAWQAINYRVKQILFRLINFSRRKDIEVIFVAHLKHLYTAEGQELPETKIDVKNYILSSVDEIIETDRDGTSFYIKRTKSPKGPAKEVKWNCE